MKLDDTLSILEVINLNPSFSDSLIKKLDQESLLSLCYHENVCVRMSVAEYMDSINISLMMNDKDPYVRKIVAKKIDIKYLSQMENDESFFVCEIVKDRLKQNADLKVNKNGDLIISLREEHVEYIKNRINESLKNNLSQYIGSPLTQNTIYNMQTAANNICYNLQIPNEYLKMNVNNYNPSEVIFNFDENKLIQNWNYNYFNHIDKTKSEIMAQEDQRVFDALENTIETVTFETTSKISVGHNCVSCNQHNEYAEPNQSNGTYICFNCR